MSIPHIGDKAFRTARIVKDSVRSALIPGGIFEELGFHYIGPVDGHNIALMQDIFCRAKEMDGPILIHIHTKKGKGYLPAEKCPENSMASAALTVKQESVRRKPALRHTPLYSVMR